MEILQLLDFIIGTEFLSGLQEDSEGFINKLMVRFDTSSKQSKQMSALPHEAISFRHDIIPVQQAKGKFLVRIEFFKTNDSSCER